MPPRSKVKPGEPSIVVEWENRKHVIRLGDVTGRHVREFRETTGLSWSAITTGRVPYDIDVAAALVWFAHHVNGKPASYDALLDSMNAANWDRVALKREMAPLSADGDEDDSPEG